jgi:hypothetical protein
MSKPFGLILFSIGLAVLSLASDIRAESDRTIYGKDDRREIYQEPDVRLRTLAKSVAAMIPAKSFVRTSRGKYMINAKTYQEEFHLCDTERFKDEISAADCTAFLISPDKLATAGHCVSTAADCADYRFVFDFIYETQNSTPSEVLSSNIYRCRKITVSRGSDVGPDFAIIELDRPVKNRKPLKLRTKGQVQPGENLLMIGSPEGLPLKIAGGAKVRSYSENQITANLDALGGNSGSPVFNQQTLDVEGVLVNGDDDLITLPKSQCSVSVVCPNDGCLGEGLTPIAHLKHLIKNSLI